MTRRRAFVAVAAFAAAALLSPSPRAQSPQPATQDPGRAGQPPAFRSGVDLVSLTVTATDGGGRYVRDLGEGDFEIYEDGARQDVSFFTRTNLPLAVSLLLDTSASMEDKMATVQTAATGFIRQLRPEDQAQVIDFDNRVTVIVPFSGNQATLEQGIRATAAGGSTALYNAIYIALKELKKVQARAAADLRRQAIVVLSDGEDTSSLVSFEEVLEQAKRSETAIYAIALKSKDYLTSKGYNEADYVLRQLTTQTGGRVFFPTAVNELPDIYRQISEELSSQYALGYSSRNAKRDGRWRRIVVRITRPGVLARTKQGYYGPTL
ncbi:MAG: VWA domain-containing protein [Vicinamibacterales bacterium]|nr:VWA domain-containing protein [Vicinamibacterales bacterium]